MTSYYTIHNSYYPNGRDRTLVSICYCHEQADECYNRILYHGMGMSYIVMERIETNTVGLIVSRVILSEDWVYA